MIYQNLNKYQYIVPHHLISEAMGKLANSKNIWLKNKIIDWFCSHYTIDMSEAAQSDPHAYATFNDFFTRALKPSCRPIDPDPATIASPADGAIAQLGRINGQQLLQAKNMYFNLNTLLGGQQQLADEFANGSFATIYLAPHNYHRVHMPVTGKLRQQIFIPGRLFSVNKITSEIIPNLYARNERLVLVFDTDTGPMTVILVGAMIVGSIQTVWMDTPIRHPEIEVTTPMNVITLEKGAELGKFLMGSTAIVLFNDDRLATNNQLRANDSIKVGQTLTRLSLS